jgi:hypothetical protein
LLLLTLCLPIGSPAETGPSVDELLAFMQISPAEKAQVMSGQIVSREIGEGSAKELAIGIVMFVPAPLEKLVGAVTTENMLAKDPSTLAFSEVREEKARSIDMRVVKFGPKDADEVEQLLEVEPGDQFNLSASEIQSFNALKDKVRDPSQQAGEASNLYGRALFQRMNAYRNGGLSAVAPYDRGDGDFAKPGEELTLAMKESRMLAKFFPLLHKALLEYPNSQPEGMVHRFFWINQTVEERPTFILSHRMKFIQPEGAFLAERQYYVGHSYNSMQILAGCIPAQGGTLVFYSNRTFTDQVAGFAQGMRHSIGRDRMKEEIVKGFEEIRRNAKSQ